MRILLPGILLAVIILNVHAGEEEVLQTFRNYQIAVFNEDGDLGYQQIDGNTRDYYKKMLDLARFASAVESKALSLTDKFLLVRTRHELDAETLASLNAESYFKYAVNHGWIDKQSLSGLELTNIGINQTSAHSTFRKNGQTAGFGFEFQRENDVWKIDLTSVFPALEASLQKSAQNFSGGGDALILHVIGVITRKPVDALVWFPPMKRPLR